MFPGETIMSGANNCEFGTNGYSGIKILKSSAGYYLGTTYNGVPGTRETDYFQSIDEAENALSEWAKDNFVGMR